MIHSFISPISYLDIVPHTKVHLVLAHLLLDKTYRDFYTARQDEGATIIMDNGAYEFKTPMSMDKIIATCYEHDFYPDVLVLPDYPYQPWQKTIDEIDRSVETFMNIGWVFKPTSFMAVPQSLPGDHEGWFKAYEKIGQSNFVEWVGMSIIGIPNAFSNLFETQDISECRTKLTQWLKDHHMVIPKNHHYLGCSSPKEVLNMKGQGVAYSNDSSSAIWHGHLHIPYDDSPTGLKMGKSKVEVDFFCPRDPFAVQIIEHNVGLMSKWVDL